VNPIPEITEIVPGALLSYAKIRALFGWCDNRTIRDYVSRGLLTRVQVGGSTRDFFITAASAKSLREHMLRVDADADYALKARMQTMRASKGKLPMPGEVLLDAEAIIEQSRVSRPLQDNSPEVGNVYQSPQPVRRERLGFSSRRGF
jgi:hypothetical protein